MAGTGSRGVPRAGAARCLLLAANFMSHNVLLSERANLSFLRAVGRFPHRTCRRDPGRHHEAQPHLRALVAFTFERQRTNFSSVSGRCLCCRWRRLGAMIGRDIQTSFVPSLPDSVTNDTTGRLTLSWGRSWGVLAGRLAFLFSSRHDSTRQRRGKIATLSTIHGFQKGGDASRCKITLPPLS